MSRSFKTRLVIRIFQRRSISIPMWRRSFGSPNLKVLTHISKASIIKCQTSKEYFGDDEKKLIHHLHQFVLQSTEKLHEFIGIWRFRKKPRLDLLWDMRRFRRDWKDGCFRPHNEAPFLNDTNTDYVGLFLKYNFYRGSDLFWIRLLWYRSSLFL